jgi:hypothetical protein
MNTQEKIEIMQAQIAVMEAYDNGAEVEYSRRGDNDIWHQGGACPNYVPRWSWEVYDYRIKPQTKVIWVNEYDDAVLAYDSERAAKSRCGSCATRAAVEYIELTDEIRTKLGM